jgi:glycosyltransferase involved in cell wall biosynthesis
MKASVVIPVHNKAPFLRACLDSVFAQSFTEFEVIAVDDASTDGSGELLRSVMDPRLRIITLDRNVGPGSAAQRGMDAATGEYILRVDADDVMVPDRFEAQIRMLDADPSIGACSGHVTLMSDPSILYRVPLEDADCKARLLFGVALNQQVTAYRRAVLERHGVRFGDDWPRYGEDWMQHLQLARVTRLKNMDRSLAFYRTGSNNIAHGRDRASDLRGLYRYVFAHYGLPLPEDKVDLQLYTVKCFPRPITPASVVAYKAWLKGLETIVRERGLFDQAAFQRQLHGTISCTTYRATAWPRSGPISVAGHASTGHAPTTCWHRS